MIKLFGIIMALGLGAVTSARADITCTAEKVGIAQESLELTINEATKEVTVKIGTDQNKMILDHSVWDGHASGLMTGKGFAFVYNNWYGCIRNAELITDLRLNGSVGNIGKVALSVCKGGSTADDLCYPEK